MALIPSGKRDFAAICVSSFLFEYGVGVCRIWKVMILGTLGVPIKTSKVRVLGSLSRPVSISKRHEIVDIELR